jgi:soluble lytic murein transglycosylase-like protein
MKCASLLAIAVFAAASPAGAQTLQEYLKLRNAHGITQAVGIPALETFVGKRIMEVQGVVKGTFRVGNRQGVLVERTDGESLTIYADAIPEWISGNSVGARLLVSAERSEDGFEMTARLLGVASESEVARIEATERQKLAAMKAKAVPKKLTTPPKTQIRTWNLSASQALPHYAAFVKRRNPRLTDRQAWDIAIGIIGFSIKYGVDARLIMAMVMVESGFNPEATSRAGAQGLGQLMPGTARGMGIANAYDTFQNLYGTVRVIRGHMERYSKRTESDFESLVLALAAYNAGSGAVRKHNGVPPYRETQNYIRKVISAYYSLSGAK